MARIRVSGSVSDFRTKLQILPTHWNQKKGRGKGNAPEIENLNTTLSAIENIIHSIKNNYLIEKGGANATQIKEAYIRLTKTEEEKEVEQFFDGKEWIVRRREKTNVERKVLLLETLPHKDHCRKVC